MIGTVLPVIIYCANEVTDRKVAIHDGIAANALLD